MSIDLPINIKICGKVDTMSGVPQMAYWNKFFIAIYENIACTQMATVSCTGEIRCCMDTKLVFQLRPSQQWFKLHASFFDNTGVVEPFCVHLTVYGD